MARAVVSGETTYCLFTFVCQQLTVSPVPLSGSRHAPVWVGTTPQMGIAKRARGSADQSPNTALEEPVPAAPNRWSTSGLSWDLDQVWAREASERWATGGDGAPLMLRRHSRTPQDVILNAEFPDDGASKARSKQAWSPRGAALHRRPPGRRAML